ncbi:MAG: PQQ-binding-like beta-propeller repeat protein [Acidobacteriota bacterium]|nr:PQQ-binding-like beta-propeller repeat protein [Acidobacteriota bacterium]
MDKLKVGDEVGNGQSPGRKFTTEDGAIVGRAASGKNPDLISTANFQGEDSLSILFTLEERPGSAFFPLTVNFLRQAEHAPLIQKLMDDGYTGSYFDQALADIEEQKAGHSSGKSSAGKAFIPSLSTAWLAESPGKITGLGFLGQQVLWATESGQVFVAKAETGEIVKSLNLETKFVLPPAAGSGGLWLVAGSDLHLINEKGELVREIAGLPGLIAPPVEEDGQLFLIGQSIQKKLNAVSGQPVWQSYISIDPSVLPAWGSSSIFLLATSGSIIKLDKQTGMLSGQYNPIERISSLVSLPDEKNLLLGTESGKVVKYNLKSKKISWSVSLGNQAVEQLLVKGRDVYVLTSVAVLYRLNSGSGQLENWQGIPARLFGRPLIFSNEIIVPALSNLLFGFELKSIRNASRTVLPADLATDLVLWPASLQTGTRDLLFAGLYDDHQDKSQVLAFIKEPQLLIEASPSSPQLPGQRIVVTVKASGFSQPKYEFYLRSGEGQEKLRRKGSTSNTWTWFPVKEGEYTIVVKVTDKKLTRRAELRYNITRFLNQTEKERSQL